MSMSVGMSFQNNTKKQSQFLMRIFQRVFKNLLILTQKIIRGIY